MPKVTKNGGASAFDGLSCHPRRLVMPKTDSIFPDPDKLNHMEYGKFVLTNLAARRAKQIRDGAPPLVRIESNHPLSIALAEIAAGKIKPVLGTLEQAGTEIDEYAALDTTIDTEGLLLPGMEDEDLAVLGLDDDLDLELEGEEDLLSADDPDAASISDLLEDDLPAAGGDEAEVVSLDDLAGDEEAAAEESSEDGL